MSNKKSLNELINEFLDDWDCKQHMRFLTEAMQLIDLYDVDEDDDWVKNAVGEENEQNVRLIRTVYIVSRIAEFHAGKLASIRVKYKNLWERMEREGLAIDEK